MSQPAAGFVSAGGVIETPQITINNNFTPAQAFDPANITGVGQFFTDAGGGSIGLCTATLINPRVVLFAAHCVNNQSATAYGANSGGVGTAIGFETNTRANGPGQNDELVNWLLGAGNGPGKYKTNTAQALYNISQVFYNPLSISATSCTAPGSCFLEADVATAVLDTPARNIPTWALLFSPLVSPATINPATGTGYHVVIEGYGRNGTGTTGSVGNDFRRRVAENMLGALTSLNDRNLFLFGTTGSPSRPQVLYMMDFDDPARGTPTANSRDFNGFRDNALPREGLTGPGDSGGPLILDRTFAKQVVIGTLSGGSTFYNGQPGGSYGTQSFYQPLFLYWDWIVANNPYRYVTANAGNKNWEDATAWVTTLDPNYNILVGGQLVNGVPTNLGGGPTANAPQFGEFCFQSPNSSNNPSYNECQSTNGTIRSNVPNNPTDQTPIGGVLTVQVSPDDSGASAAVETKTLAGGSNDFAIAGGAAVGINGANDSPQADPGFSNTVAPAPTLANGLPGATNFVPSNVDGVRTTGVMGRYYDVTLRNTGVVTLNSAVTIDRFTLGGATAQLSVATGASLTSLMEFNQYTGTVMNNGTVTSNGDYFLASGLLTGSGRVNSPFLTSLLGTIAPGTVGGIGTLTLGGNLVLSSGSGLLIDLGAGQTSDLISVVAGSGNSGAANVGGAVSFSRVTGSLIRNNDLFTFLTAAGGVTGTFATPSSISAILSPTLIYTPNAVQVRLTASSYLSSLGTLTAEQAAYARLLDGNRTNTGAQPLYDFLDLQDAATIRATLTGLSPEQETLVRSVGTVALENTTRMFADRVAGLDAGGSFDGSVAMVGSPLQVLAMGQAGALNAGIASAAQPMDVAPGRLPNGTRGFFAGGYLNGDARSAATGLGTRDDFDGYYAAAGVEARVDENGAIGFALSYTDAKGTTSALGQRVKGKLYSGTLYGKTTLGGLDLDTQFTSGVFQVRTRRAAVVGPTTYDLRSRDNALAIATEVGIGKMYGEGIQFGPRAAFRATSIGYTPTAETGGAPALRFNRGTQSSAQGLFGLRVGGGVANIRPYGSAYFVHEFLDQPASYGANFVGGVGGNSLFALAGHDRNWGELSAGLTVGSGRTTFSVGADTTVFRKDVSNQSYRGSISFKF